mgnify:CR=1 FL=1
MNSLTSKFKNKETLFAVLAMVLIAFALISRLLPHPPNFTPIAAVAIFGALYLPKRWTLIIPLGALLLSDALIGFYAWKIMLAVYGSFALTGLIALAARKHKNALSIFSATLAGSILFFIITNAAVWMFGTMYPFTFEGLFQCYMIAIPFFKNTLMGDMFYVGVLVGITEVAFFAIKTRLVPQTINRAE